MRYILLLLALSAALTTQAQQYYTKPFVAYQAETQEAAPILTTFLQATQAQRQKLEAYLSPTDKQLLAAARVAVQLNSAARVARTYLYDFQPIGQQARYKLAQVNTAPMQQVRELAQKYRAPIAQLLTALAPQRQHWRAQLQAVEQKYAAHLVPFGMQRNFEVVMVAFADPLNFLLDDPSQTSTPAPGPFWLI